MVKYLAPAAIFALTPFAIEPLHAQSFPKPPDVPAYVAVTPQYETTPGVANLTIDPTVTPMTVTPLTNIPIPSTTGRIKTTAPGGANFCLTTFNGGSCQEAKFRTSVDFTVMMPDDPIRNFGQAGTSHLHCFFGSGSPNAFSTYKTLRNHALNSAAAGSDANATAYWIPCPVVMNPYGDGKNYAIKLDFATVYYTANPADMQRADYIKTGKRYVFGFDMDSASTATQYAWLQTILDSHNATIGSTRYQLRNPSGKLQTQASYTCSGATPLTVNYIKLPDGGDPHGGTCASGATYFVKIDGPACYDGKNLWSPGGYKHLIPSIWDNSFSKFVCPKNYYRVPSLTLELFWTQHGWADRQRWDLSSDISYRVAKGLTSVEVPSGSTFHTDWLDGWDDVQRKKWEDNCNGVRYQTPHECNTSQISDTEALLGGAVGENGVNRSPQINFGSNSRTLQTGPGWMLIPPSWSGGLTAHKVKP
jgi:hypothetical protein